MHLSTAILGAGAVKQLQHTGGSAVLVCGRDRLTRGDLARVGCFNFIAARHLSDVLATLDAPNLRAVFERIAPTTFAVPGVGAISLAVLGAAFEARGIGGETPLETYVRKHANGDAATHMVTFHTLKARELAEQRQEKVERRRRTERRRRKAHEIRVARFGARASVARHATTHDSPRPR